MIEAFKVLASICLATFGVYLVFYWDRAERKKRRSLREDWDE